MNNKKYYPFERNNYFYGKLLTVRDFEIEQRYFNDKRRINNILTNGIGVVSGLNTILLDDKTISIEAGMALDYLGREIVVDESVTKKLNVIDGFEEINDFENVYLCIEYDQSKTQMVHSISSTENEENNNYSRIAEGYRLFLTDKLQKEEVNSLNDLKENSKVIYNSNGIKITQVVPKYMTVGATEKIKIIIEKINLPKVIEIDYTMLSDYIKAKDNDNLRVYYKDEDIQAYKKIELEYEVISKNTVKDDAKVVINIENSSVNISNNKYMFDKATSFDFSVIKGSINEKVVTDYMQLHFDKILNSSDKNVIYLSKMRVVQKDKQYFIDSFEKMPFEQYVLSNQMLYTLINNNNNNNTNNINDEILQMFSQVAATKQEDTSKNLSYFKSGQELIQVDMHSKNKSYFSEQIAHGLGEGDVLINVAIEDEYVNNSIYDVKTNVFGDIDVFKKSIYETSIKDIKLGVISYTDKGTFRIGIKCLEDVNITAIKVKWWAYKNNKMIESDIADINNINVVIEPNTIKIKAREKFKFEAVVKGTSNQECKWSVTDKDGGEIDINGLYEAPSQPGVYEVIAESVKYPNKKATAFVVIEQK